VSTALHLLPAPLEPQPHGGALRRGNPGNKGRSKSALARRILEAGTPKAAKQLVHIATKGELPEKDGASISIQDRLKAIDILLARGGVPIRTELTGADGQPFTVLLGAAGHAT